MDKDMYEISVWTEDGKVCIIGRPPGDDGNGYGRVTVPPEQIDMLITWLQEAKAELSKSE